jgi:hypothetical protein
MKIRLSKSAVRQYIRILQELENADLSSNSVELDLTIFSPLSGQSQQLKEMLYEDYGDESPNLEISVSTKKTQALNTKVARKKLRAKLLKAESLTICDPYLFAKPPKKNLETYLDNLLSVLPLKTLHFLVIVHDKEKGNPQLIREFKKRIPNTIKLSIRTNSTIHDRVWIVDKNTAFVVGTSFGGIGRRLSFLLDLPDDDLARFKRYLFRSSY